MEEEVKTMESVEKTGIEQYVDMEDVKLAVEKSAEAVWQHVLLPGLEKLVQSTSNAWDDAALGVAKGMITDLLNGISPKDGD